MYVIHRGTIVFHCTYRWNLRLDEPNLFAHPHILNRHTKQTTATSAPVSCSAWTSVPTWGGRATSPHTRGRHAPWPARAKAGRPQRGPATAAVPRLPTPAPVCTYDPWCHAHHTLTVAPGTRWQRLWMHWQPNAPLMLGSSSAMIICTCACVLATIWSERMFEIHFAIA